MSTFARKFSFSREPFDLLQLSRLFSNRPSWNLVRYRVKITSQQTRVVTHQEFVALKMYKKRYSCEDILSYIIYLLVNNLVIHCRLFMNQKLLGRINSEINRHISLIRRVKKTPMKTQNLQISGRPNSKFLDIVMFNNRSKFAMLSPSSEFHRIILVSAPWKRTLVDTFLPSTIPRVRSVSLLCRQSDQRYCKYWRWLLQRVNMFSLLRSRELFTDVIESTRSA